MARSQLVDLDFSSVARATNLLNPTAAQDAATKSYVDAAVEGLAWKDNVRVAAQVNVTISGPGATINEISMVLNDRVLLFNQTAPAENGIYIWNGAAVAMTRAPDASSFDELEQAVVTVDEGSSAAASFRQTAINGTLGSTAIVWGSFGTAASAATETLSGVAELATQAETDAGTDDLRIVTPFKLANHSGRKLKATAIIGDGSATSFNVDHNFGTREVLVSVCRNSTPFDDVIADVTRPTTNRVTIGFAVAPASNSFVVTVIG
jgi:hypothetical protein